ITASVMGEVCRRTKVAPDNLLKKICGYTDESHNYMFQVQGQMAVYELSLVDFVVYTKKDINVERIRFSPSTWDMIGGVNL
ncbi:uncharacterized protein LOC126817885, partial [Patella vulgata]|uniref:uncharacterized protein LOC126817885 n=1 Tax=Patella vulgata TaxID=6465 RepID=UPI00217F4E45